MKKAPVKNKNGMKLHKIIATGGSPKDKKGTQGVMPKVTKK